MPAQIADVMSWSILTIRPECPVADALVFMVDSEVDELFVTTGEGHFCGVLTDFEILKAELNGSLDTLVAADLMQSSAARVEPEQSVMAAVKLLRDSRVMRIPVVWEGCLVGAIQRRDVLRWISQRRAKQNSSTVQPPKFLNRQASLTTTFL